MNHHSQSKAHVNDDVEIEHERSFFGVQLCEKLQALEEIAKTRYNTLKNIAKRSDDAQFEYTSEAEHWLQGARITMTAALRAAQNARNTQGE
jgi:hypothetical protein